MDARGFAVLMPAAPEPVTSLGDLRLPCDEHDAYDPHVFVNRVLPQGGYGEALHCLGGRSVTIPELVEALRKEGFIVVDPDPLSAWWPWPEWAIEATAHVMGWQRGEVPTARGILNALSEAQDALAVSQPTGETE